MSGNGVVEKAMRVADVTSMEALGTLSSALEVLCMDVAHVLKTN